MKRFATIFLAFFAFAASAGIDVAAAASATDAIKAWIAAVPGNDWKIAYKNLAYDMASDKTTLTGLTATSTSLKLTIGFDSIVMAGYTPAADGSFTAAALSINNGTATSKMADAKITIAGVSVTNFGSGVMIPVAFDATHPFSSIVQMYSDLLKVQIDHGAIASVNYSDTAGDNKFAYSNLAIDKWSNGKIGSMTSGPIVASFTDDSGTTGGVKVGGFESHNLDMDAALRVYDASRYVNGAGDGVWHQVLGDVTYHDMSVTGDNFNFSLGTWTMQDMKMRQPAHSFTPALDVAAASGDSDLGPDGVHALFDMWSAYSLGKFSVSNVAVKTDDGSGSLGDFTLSDISSDGLGEIAIDNLDTTFPDGFAKIGRLALGGFVFPGVDKLSAAYDATQNGDDVDYSTLAPKLGYAEAASIDMLSPLAPETKLDKARLDLTNYVGEVPTNVALTVSGLDAPSDFLDEDGSDISLKDLGYDRIHLDAGAKITWNEADSTVTIDGLNASLANIGNVSGKVVLSGLTRDALNDVNSLPEALQSLNLVSSTATIEDKSIFSHWLAQQAFEMGIGQEDFRKQLLAQIPDFVSELGDSPFKAKMAAAIKTVHPGAGFGHPHREAADAAAGGDRRADRIALPGHAAGTARTGRHRRRRPGARCLYLRPCPRRRPDEQRTGRSGHAERRPSARAGEEVVAD